MGNSYDVVVIGSGMAGLTAGLFAARDGRSVIVLTGEQLGGHLVSVGVIEDYPGFPEGVAGYDLCPMMQEQAEAAGAQFAMTSAQTLGRDGDRWTVRTDDGEYSAAVVVVAAGAAIASLGVAGEDRLRGHGVSDCATCDGPLHRGNTVAVVGGGDSALLEALELTNHVDKVVIVHRGAALDGQDSYRTRVLASDKIEVRYRSTVSEILGEQVVTGIAVRDEDSGATEQVPVSGVFAYVGLVPRTGLVAEHLHRDATGRVRTDLGLRTALPGLFAVGDARSGFAGQAICAAGDGASAAVAAASYLDGGSWPYSDDQTGAAMAAAG